MTQNTAIKLGVIAICFATVPLSLAQTPGTGTSRSNRSGTNTGATAGHSGLIGNPTSGAPLGTNFRSSTITAPNTNVGTHIAINAGAQAGISAHYCRRSEARQCQYYSAATHPAAN
jgi:hypothetical protein